MRKLALDEVASAVAIDLLLIVFTAILMSKNYLSNEQLFVTSNIDGAEDCHPALRLCPTDKPDFRDHSDAFVPTNYRERANV
jgi:hypothetical protein